MRNYWYYIITREARSRYAPSSIETTAQHGNCRESRRYLRKNRRTNFLITFLRPPSGSSPRQYYLKLLRERENGKFSQGDFIVAKTRELDTRVDDRIAGECFVSYHERNGNRHGILPDWDSSIFKTIRQRIRSYYKIASISRIFFIYILKTLYKKTSSYKKFTNWNI